MGLGNGIGCGMGCGVGDGKPRDALWLEGKLGGGREMER